MRAKNTIFTVHQRHQCTNIKLYLHILDGEISGRGCAAKDRIFTVHQRHLCLHFKLYLPFLDGEISGRGCATKDRIFTRHCENHVMKGIQVINT